MGITNTSLRRLNYRSVSICCVKSITREEKGRGGGGKARNTIAVLQMALRLSGPPSPDDGRPARRPLLFHLNVLKRRPLAEDLGLVDSLPGGARFVALVHLADTLKGLDGRLRRKPRGERGEADCFYGEACIRKNEVGQAGKQPPVFVLLSTHLDIRLGRGLAGGADGTLKQEGFAVDVHNVAGRGGKKERGRRRRVRKLRCIMEPRSVVRRPYVTPLAPLTRRTAA